MDCRISCTSLLFRAVMFLTLVTSCTTVSMLPDPVEVSVGETDSLKVKVTTGGKPQANTLVQFEAMNQEIVTIAPGKAKTNLNGEATAELIGRSEGRTTITATAKGKTRSGDVLVRAGREILKFQADAPSGFEVVDAFRTIRIDGASPLVWKVSVDGQQQSGSSVQVLAGDVVEWHFASGFEHGVVFQQFTLAERLSIA